MPKDPKNKEQSDSKVKSNEQTQPKAKQRTTDVISTQYTFPFARPISHNFDDDMLFSYHAVTPLVDIFKTVSEFGRTRKRIFTGGMAIDLALKSVGSYIYDNFDIDFDFFSPEFHKDAFDLAKLISQNRDPRNINAIVAMHVSTMRVRFRWNAVADITYVPPELYKKIPILSIDLSKIRGTSAKMKHKELPYLVVHPAFQMIDQHVSMSQPYANEPMINIMGRCKKDFMRMLKLAHFFNIPDELKRICKAEKDIPPRELPDKKILELFREINKTFKVCIGGGPAVEYWLNHKELSDSSLFDNQTIIYSFEYAKVVDFVSKLIKQPIKWFRKTLDKIPANASVGPFVIYNTHHKWLAAEEKNGVTYAGLHTVGSLSLSKAIFEDSKEDIAIYENLHKGYLKLVKQYESEENIANVLLCPTYYGAEKIAESRVLISKKMCANFLRKKPDANRDTPMNFYPDKGEADYDFKPENSHVLQYDGKQSDGPEDISNGPCDEFFKQKSKNYYI